ncbi:hypothetical protein GJAV_G00241000 [Gymnothorax javanicus]|nr:hypothetical protein GJAV_G00241000 [Gymnothorax javanicus]
MQPLYLNNRAESHFSPTQEHELDSMRGEGIVNLGYSRSPPLSPLSTIYNPKPVLANPYDSPCKLELPAPGTAESKSFGEHQGKPSSGCCSFISRAVRGLWSTTLTEDTSKNREMYVKTTIRELTVYIIFLLDMCLLTYGMTSSTAYYYNKAMTDLFVNTASENGIKFQSISSMTDLWDFAEGPLLDGLYWTKWYNGELLKSSTKLNGQSFIFYENLLLGVPRMRQLKVTNNSCKVHSDFRQNITDCYDVYSIQKEDTDPFGRMNGTAWEYHTEKELKGSSHWALLTSYSGGGYYQDLKLSKEESAAVIMDLKENRWLDRGTRVVLIDFTAYNANINLFCVIRLVVEFPASGGAIPSYQIRTVRLIRYITSWDFFIIGCEIVFCIFILYYVVEEILEIRIHKLSYFSSIWNILDLLVILVFKYISFNKTMTQLSSTLARCAKDILGFAIMFFIVFFAYAQLGYLVFGTEVESFSTFVKCIFTQFRIILGDFDYDAIDKANRILGPLYFVTYVFFVFFVLLNMFLAIINDTYSEVKEELSKETDELQFTDIIKQSYMKTFMKLKFKKERIIDVQKALQTSSKELEFKDFRETLKELGHADSEIAAAFSKFDHDGNQILDEEEQTNMKRELKEKRDALNAEINTLGKNYGKKVMAHMKEQDDTLSDNKEGLVSQEAFHMLVRQVIQLEDSVATIMGKMDLPASSRSKNNITMPTILANIVEARWEIKIDPHTGWPFFVDHNNRITTWNDPRHDSKKESQTSNGPCEAPPLEPQKLYMREMKFPTLRQGYIPIPVTHDNLDQWQQQHHPSFPYAQPAPIQRIRAEGRTPSPTPTHPARPRSPVKMAPETCMSDAHSGFGASSPVPSQGPEISSFGMSCHPPPAQPMQLQPGYIPIPVIHEGAVGHAQAPSNLHTQRFPQTEPTHHRLQPEERTQQSAPALSPHERANRNASPILIPSHLRSQSPIRAHVLAERPPVHQHVLKEATSPEATAEEKTIPSPTQMPQFPQAHTPQYPQKVAPEKAEEVMVHPGLAKVQKIVERVQRLEQEVKCFDGKKNDKRYLILEELLMKELLALDSVDPEGRADVRQARRDGVRKVQNILEGLEALGEEPEPPSSEKMPQGTEHQETS